MKEIEAPELFDSHAHLEMVVDKVKGTGKSAEEEVDEIVNRAWNAGLTGIVTIAGATKVGQFEDALYIANKYQHIWAAAGVHPHCASDATLDVLNKLRFVLDEKKVIAIGEIGLDYHYNYSTPALQRKIFIEQIKIAHKVSLPIVVHTREADDDTLAILKDEGAEKIGGVIHCFSSGQALANEAIDIGFYLSFSGIVTFPKTADIQAVAAIAPNDRILAETDSPFLSPIPFRGKVNEPAHVLHVVEKLAELRKIDICKLGSQIVENTKKCFGLI